MVGVFRKNIGNQCGGDNVSEAGMNQRLKKKKKKGKAIPSYLYRHNKNSV